MNRVMHEGGRHSFFIARLSLTAKVAPYNLLKWDKLGSIPHSEWVEIMARCLRVRSYRSLQWRWQNALVEG
ncbi:hypothetical protein NC651_037584 [Populus alba x Populus x berolinensis]|nr:hypothetical protein NC651_037584 [Populus alba x Populus x berolinensis]